MQHGNCRSLAATYITAFLHILTSSLLRTLEHHPSAKATGPREPPQVTRAREDVRLLLKPVCSRAPLMIVAFVVVEWSKISETQIWLHGKERVQDVVIIVHQPAHTVCKRQQASLALADAWTNENLCLLLSEQITHFHPHIIAVILVLLLLLTTTCFKPHGKGVGDLLCNLRVGSVFYICGLLGCLGWERQECDHLIAPRGMNKVYWIKSNWITTRETTAGFAVCINVLIAVVSVGCRAFNEICDGQYRINPICTECFQYFWYWLVLQPFSCLCKTI